MTRPPYLMSRFPKFCITADEDPRIEMFCTHLEVNTAFEAHKLPVHRDRAVLYLYSTTVILHAQAHLCTPVPQMSTHTA